MKFFAIAASLVAAVAAYGSGTSSSHLAFNINKLTKSPQTLPRPAPSSPIPRPSPSPTVCTPPRPLHPPLHLSLRTPRALLPTRALLSPLVPAPPSPPPTALLFLFPLVPVFPFPFPLALVLLFPLVLVLLLLPALVPTRLLPTSPVLLAMPRSVASSLVSVLSPRCSCKYVAWKC